MKYHIITPVGTSLIRSNQVAEPLLKELRGKDSEIKIIKHFYKKYEEHFLALMKRDPYKSCAEVNSFKLFLNKYSCEHTTVTLLPTDTAESYLSCLFIARYFESEGYEVRKEVIKGLSYSNPKEFRRAGLKNLIGKVRHEIVVAKQKGNTPVINATAGFKAESAILLLLAQLLGLDVFYAHELMRNDLVTFPNLPVTLDPKYWMIWKPIVQAVIDAEKTDSGVMPVNQFEEITQYLELAQGRILFDLDEDFGGMILSTMGLLLANTFQLTGSKIVLEKSEVLENKRIKLNEREMAHAPKGSRNFIDKLARITIIKSIRNDKFVNTLYSRVKPKYDKRDPNEIRMIYSDNEKGVELVVLTTARNETENIEAKKIIAEQMNLNNEVNQNEHQDYLFLPGQLLDSQFSSEIISLAEKIEKAENIIQQGDEIIKPYVEDAEKERKKAKGHRKEKEQIAKNLKRVRLQNKSLKDELENLKKQYEDESAVDE